MSSHMGVAECTCYILALKERRSEFLRAKWQPFQNEQTVCFARQMDRGELLRENSERLMEGVEDDEGGDRPPLNECKVEIGKLDNEWGTRGDYSRGGNKEPPLTREEWLKLMDRQIEALRSCRDWKTQPEDRSGST